MKFSCYLRIFQHITNTSNFWIKHLFDFCFSLHQSHFTICKHVQYIRNTLMIKCTRLREWYAIVIVITQLLNIFQKHMVVQRERLLYVHLTVNQQIQCVILFVGRRNSKKCSGMLHNLIVIVLRICFLTLFSGRYCTCHRAGNVSLGATTGTKLSYFYMSFWVKFWKLHCFSPSRFCSWETRMGILLLRHRYVVHK